MKRSFSITLIVIVVLALGYVFYHEVIENKMKEITCTKPSVQLRMAMRKLWEDHITWTRCYIVSALSGADDSAKIAERLLRNQDEIGNAIKPFYGEDAASKLAALLRDHIMIASQVVKAAKANNATELKDAQTKWFSNADDIAVFLSSANPNWPMKDLQQMLYKHLDLTTSEVVSRLKKDWSADIDAYDMGHEHMLMFADMLSNGIIMQFQDRFKKNKVKGE
ncbi:MAG: glycosyltransferase [bacterium]